MATGRPDMNWHEHLVAARTNPEQHLESFIERTRRQVQRKLRNQVLDPELRNDAASEAVIAVWHSLHRCNARDSKGVLMWINGIARHKGFRQFRQRRVGAATTLLGTNDLEPQLDRAVAFGNHGTPVRVEDAQTAAAVRAAYQQLERSSPLLAATLKLKHVEDLDYAEIAKRLKIKEGTARIRVMRALAKLRESLDSNFEAN